MTFERRIIFDLDDIQSVLIECKKCKARIQIPAGQTILGHRLDACEFCRRDWLVDDAAPRFLRLLTVLHEVILLQKNAGFTMRLEFGEPDRPQP